MMNDAAQRFVGNNDKPEMEEGMPEKNREPMPPEKMRALAEAMRPMIKEMMEQIMKEMGGKNA